MDIIRLATEEEVNEIAPTSDLFPGCLVYSFGTARAVLRNALELDPVIFGDLSNNQKRYFMTALETHLRLSGAPHYYFNASASEEATQYRKVIESWGAVAMSREPEIRYKKQL